MNDFDRRFPGARDGVSALIVSLLDQDIEPLDIGQLLALAGAETLAIGYGPDNAVTTLEAIKGVIRDGFPRVEQTSASHFQKRFDAHSPALLPN